MGNLISNFGYTRSKNKLVSEDMLNTSSTEWLEKAVFDEHINYIEYNKFTNPTLIGIGGFGKVFKYEWKDCGLTVALKCLKVDTDLSSDERIIRDFIHERPSFEKYFNSSRKAKNNRFWIIKTDK
ncbi:kinase-like domain-containing protein [Gigaspora margarita]|uniref:Kinase-like domain-containing protein n=1 Tax=Gigaspora margarita TaxID=4874 RepID=A0A8H4A257_GIGMA|nr:kinase-like domain-containing protein [Gigaspora margarita]